jgi:hypothetical protein
MLKNYFSRVNIPHAYLSMLMVVSFHFISEYIAPNIGHLYCFKSIEWLAKKITSVIKKTIVWNLSVYKTEGCIIETK